ncbi:MmgE/PrpD family protein [Amycolatopsis sp. NBC_00345]|uniref:MmgE/PrpD family protein n=1 Tax=Amycolatopsis sp. NBC_00345 TaxID=2975955 RepID=UPI002E271A59
MNPPVTSAPQPGVTTQLAEWVHGLKPGDVPGRVRDRAKHLLLDGVGAALVGAQLPWSRVATEAVLGIEGAGDSVVAGTGRTTSAPAAVLLNSTFVQGFELDDFHPIAPLHSCSLVIPAILAAARPVSGADAVTAAVAGFEVGPRVGRALHGAQMLSRGWHSGPVFGTHAAAMTTGKLAGLDAAQLEDALGMAGTQSGGLMAAQYEAMSKRMQHGFAARNGFYAARLAAAGYTGIKAVFEREYGGFLAVFGEGHDPVPGEIAAGLGERWETELIMVKSYAAMGGLHGAIDGALALRAEHGIDPALVERIDLAVGHTVYHHGWWEPERPLTPIGAQMNIAYAVAAALCDGQVLARQFTPARLDADDVWRLIDRTRVRHATEYDDGEPDRRFATDVRITMRDGTVLSRQVVTPHGSPLDPVTAEEIVAKYRQLTEPVLPAARRQAIEDAVLGLDEADDVTGLVDLLAPAVTGVLD